MNVFEAEIVRRRTGIQLFHDVKRPGKTISRMPSNFKDAQSNSFS